MNESSTGAFCAPASSPLIYIPNPKDTIKAPLGFVTRWYARYLNPLIPQRVHIQLEGSNAIDAVLRQSVPISKSRLYS